MRCWPDGAIPDRALAPSPPTALPLPVVDARALLRRTATVPRHTWGRDVMGTGDMWNSNSVVSWLLQTSGIDATALYPPCDGRAPGWATGIAAARGSHPPGHPGQPGRARPEDTGPPG